MRRFLLSALVLFGLCLAPWSLFAEDAPPDQPAADSSTGLKTGTGALLPKKKQPRGKRAEQREKILQQYDENKNGRLDPEERAKLLRDRRAQSKKTGGNRRQLNPYQAQILKQYDTNKDGKLDAKEIAKARQDMMKRQQQMMRQLQQRFRRGRGGRGRGRRGGGGRGGYGGRGGNPLQRLMQMRQRYLQQLLKQRQQQQQQGRKKR